MKIHNSIVCIVVTLSSCSALERIQSKTEMAPESKKIQEETLPKKETIEYAKRRDMIDLQNMIKQQHQDVSTLREQLLKAKLQNDEFQKVMLKNFALLERAVGELQNAPIQTDQEPLFQNPQKSKAVQTPPQLPKQKPLIEKYSLFPKSKQKIVLTPSDLDVVPVPLPPPDEKHVVREPVRATQSKTKKKPVITSAKEKNQPYSDPDLKEPRRPYILKSYPPVKKMYDQGMQALFQNQPQKAVELLSAVVKDYPDDEYGDNAMFWLGNTYFKLRKLNLAEEQFRGVLRNYEHRPTSQGYKTPDAIHMLGQIFANKNEPEKAKYYFQAVIQRFPGSTAAVTAQKDLTHLNK